MNKILLHENSYRKYPYEILFKKAKEFGYAGVEVGISDGDIKGKIEEIAKYKEKYGLEEIILHRPLRIIKDEEQKMLNQQVENFLEILDLGKKLLGVKIVNTMAGGTLIANGAKYIDYDKNGSAIAEEIHYQRAAQCFRKITYACEKEAVCLVLEIHGNLIHDTADTTIKLIDMAASPNLKINLDYANLYLRSKIENEDEIIEKLKGKIAHCHIKNLRKIACMPYDGDLSFFFTGIETGEIDNRLLVSKLKNTGYKGTFTFEYPGAIGDPDIIIKRDIAYFNELLKYC